MFVLELCWHNSRSVRDFNGETGMILANLCAGQTLESWAIIETHFDGVRIVLCLGYVDLTITLDLLVLLLCPCRFR